MPSIPDREGENATRKGRIAQQKKGPGVFKYLGTANDRASEPTIKLLGRAVAKLDSNGMPVTDASNRQVFEKQGRPVVGVNGQPMMGGIPKVTVTPITTYNLWGMDFPTGQEVTVVDRKLALKLRVMTCFEEVKYPTAEAPDFMPEEIVAPYGYKADGSVKKKPGRQLVG